jgi:tetratricopeptide (TPR) repeat protein
MHLRSVQSESASDDNDIRPSGRARLRTLLLWLMGLSAAAVIGLWFWWQHAHPGLTHYRQGIDYADRHQLDEAAREWQKGIEEEPSFPGCYERLGDLYETGRNYPAAAEKYAAAAKLSPHDGTLFLRLARVQQQLHDVKVATASARSAFELLPGDADAAILYETLARKIGDMPGALAAAQRAHTLRPSDPALLHERVHMELDTLDMAGAERDIAPWIQTHPDDAEACYLMSVVYQNKPHTPDNLKTGIDYAQRAVRGMPNHLQASLVLGQFYLDAKRPQEALKTYLAIDRNQPGNEAILHGLVECYNRLSRPDQAEKTADRLKIVLARHERITSLKNTLNSNPANVEAGLELARLEEKDGDMRAAHADYVRILNQAPEDPRVHVELAAFYRRTGRPDLAEQAETANYREEIR